MTRVPLVRPDSAFIETLQYGTISIKKWHKFFSVPTLSQSQYLPIIFDSFYLSVHIAVSVPNLNHALLLDY